MCLMCRGVVLSSTLPVRDDPQPYAKYFQLQLISDTSVTRPGTQDKWWCTTIHYQKITIKSQRLTAPKSIEGHCSQTTSVSLFETSSVSNNLPTKRIKIAHQNNLISWHSGCKVVSKKSLWDSLPRWLKPKHYSYRAWLHLEWINSFSVKRGMTIPI